GAPAPAPAPASTNAVGSGPGARDEDPRLPSAAFPLLLRRRRPLPRLVRPAAVLLRPRRGDARDPRRGPARRVPRTRRAPPGRGRRRLRRAAAGRRPPHLLAGRG